MPGYRYPVIRGIALTQKKRVIIPQATELVTERVAAMVKNILKQEEGVTASEINSMEFKTTVEVVPVDFIIDMDIPMLKPGVSPERASAPSGK